MGHLPSDESNVDLDSILLELGHFGKFQIKNYLLLTIPIFASALYTISYVFTAINPDYRCLIPECEDASTRNFRPDWLSHAVPFEHSQPEKCRRFLYVHNTTNFANFSDVCPINWFDEKELVSCDKHYVFRTKHTSIANDFDILCGEQWKLALPGTIHNVGQFISMPLTGIFSDRFGRRTAMALGLFMSAVLGLCRSFSPAYIWFITFEFLDAALGSAAYASAFILATELVSPEKRVFMATVISCAYSVGESVIGVVAWNVNSWRNVLRIVYGPGLLLILYFWLTPESMRWLITKGRHEEVENILKSAAKQNGITLSEKALANMESNLNLAQSKDQLLDEKPRYPIKEVFKSCPLLFRLVNCSICWITCVFVYYGLSLNAVEIAGNIYVNFIAVSLVEIPGYICSYLCLDRFGRKISLSGSFLVSGLACISFIFISEDMAQLKLIAFLLGKCAITMAFGVIYVYTAELFPTPLRQTLMGFCSMFGRIGSMVAPQMPLLATAVWESLPILLFGSFSIFSGFLVFFFPETLNIKLPDTIEEAINIGKKDKLKITEN